MAANERSCHHPNWTSRRPPSRPRQRLVRSPRSHTKWTNFSGPVKTYSQLQLVSVARGFGTSSAATWNYSYDPFTLRLASVTDPSGHTTSYTGIPPKSWRFRLCRFRLESGGLVVDR
jgi:YD repeat-containing protein